MVLAFSLPLALLGVGLILLLLGSRMGGIRAATGGFSLVSGPRAALVIVFVIALTIGALRIGRRVLRRRSRHGQNLDQDS